MTSRADVNIIQRYSQTNKKQQPICTDGKEHVVVISSQYDLNPWKMLEVVMSDDEYEDYISSLDDERFLFKVFYDEPLIRLAQDEQNDADLLYALSFVKEIVEKYDIDGYSLDYCRYPNMYGDFSDFSRKDFEKYLGENFRM